ncbi:MAG: hypothetical protein AAGB12_05075 [Pseudomonadota bacterium]
MTISLNNYYAAAKKEENQNATLVLNSATDSTSKATSGGNSVRIANSQEKQDAEALSESLNDFKTALTNAYPSFFSEMSFEEKFDNPTVLTPQLIRDTIVAAHKHKLNEIKTFYHGSHHRKSTASSIMSEEATNHIETNDFKTNGIALDVAMDWLIMHPDGQKFMDMLEHIEAPDHIEANYFNENIHNVQFRRAIALELVMSGSELPKRIVLKEDTSFIKLTPVGSDVSQYSMYLTTKEALRRAGENITEGSNKSLADAFGLPAGSVNGDEYTVHIINVPAGTTVWHSPIAPTSEVTRSDSSGTSKLNTQAGATQYFIGRDKTIVTGESFQVSGQNFVKEVEAHQGDKV